MMACSLNFDFTQVRPPSPAPDVEATSSDGRIVRMVLSQCVLIAPSTSTPRCR